MSYFLLYSASVTSPNATNDKNEENEASTTTSNDSETKSSAPNDGSGSTQVVILDWPEATESQLHPA